MADDGAAEVSWDLTYKQLSRPECLAFEQLFEATYGRYLTFTFLDPADNLLRWSEDPAQPDWEADPLLTRTPGLTDLFGGAGASQFINMAQAAQEIKQGIAAPASYQYCLSFYGRSAQRTRVEMFASCASGEMTAAFEASSTWARAVYPFQLGSGGDGLAVGIRLSPGAAITTFGFQLEAQPGAGAYKKTRDRAGVYPVSRFDQDVFRPAATGVNEYTCDVRIVSNVAG